MTITPNGATRRRIRRNLGKVKLKTKLKALGNLGGSDIDYRVFRLKR